jgi:hypothetical protein
MQRRLRQCLAILSLLGSAACADSPAGPSLSPDNTGPSEIGFYIPPDDGGECNKYMDANFCQGRRMGECITSAPATGRPTVGVQGCDGGGGGGGGGTTQPAPPPPAADTCLTGDEALDAPAVKQGLKDLWIRSNPDAPQAQRLEQAGWIVRSWDGSYSMVPFSVSMQGPCNINGNLNAPPGAVAWVHTHPYRRGEVQTSCPPLQEPDPSAPGGYRDVIRNGQRVYGTYLNRPSDADRQLLDQVNTLRAQLRQDQLAGVVIDADRTTVYTETPGEKPVPLPRCGY